MKKNIFLLFLILLIASCRSNQDEAFKLFYSDHQAKVATEPMYRAFLEKRLSFDTLLVQPNAQDIERILISSKEQLNVVHSFELDRINADQQKPYQKVHSFYTIIIKHIEEDQIHTNHPDFYNPLPYLNNFYKNADQAALTKGINKIGAHYELAIGTLKNGDSKVLNEAIQNGIQVFELLSNEVRDQIKTASTDKEERKVLFRKLTQARLAVKDFMGYCQSLIFENQNQSLE